MKTTLLIKKMLRYSLVFHQALINKREWLPYQRILISRFLLHKSKYWMKLSKEIKRLSLVALLIQMLKNKRNSLRSILIKSSLLRLRKELIVALVHTLLIRTNSLVWKIVTLSKEMLKLSLEDHQKVLMSKMSQNIMQVQ